MCRHRLWEPHTFFSNRRCTHCVAQGGVFPHNELFWRPCGALSPSYIWLVALGWLYLQHVRLPINIQRLTTRWPHYIHQKMGCSYCMSIETMEPAMFWFCLIWSIFQILSKHTWYCISRFTMSDVLHVNYVLLFTFCTARNFDFLHYRVYVGWREIDIYDYLHWLPARWAFGFPGDHQQNIQCVLIYRCCVLIHVWCSVFSVGNKVTIITATIFVRAHLKTTWCHVRTGLPWRQRQNENSMFFYHY